MESGKWHDQNPLCILVLAALVIEPQFYKCLALIINATH